MKLFYEPEGRLRLTLEDRSYLQVKPAWASPLSHPGKYLSLLDGKDHEIMMVEDPAKLDDDNRKIIEGELRRRYLNSQVKRIDLVKTEYGITYWTVETDRGSRELVTQSLQENANWMSPNLLVLTDVDGNRYEIMVDQLDDRSKKYVEVTV